MKTSRKPSIPSAGPEDAPALARLRYEFRVGQDPATEDESQAMCI